MVIYKNTKGLHFHTHYVTALETFLEKTVKEYFSSFPFLSVFASASVVIWCTAACPKEEQFYQCFQMLIKDTFWLGKSGRKRWKTGVERRIGEWGGGEEEASKPKTESRQQGKDTAGMTGAWWEWTQHEGGEVECRLMEDEEEKKSELSVAPVSMLSDTDCWCI